MWVVESIKEVTFTYTSCNGENAATDFIIICTVTGRPFFFFKYIWPDNDSCFM